MTAREIGVMIKDAAIKFWRDNGPRLSAAMTFYCVLALYPLILTTVAIAGMVFGEEAARGELEAQIQGTVSPDGAKVIAQLLAQSYSMGHGVWSGIVVMAMLIVSASGLFSSLQSALNAIWQAPGRTSSDSYWSLVKERFLTFLPVFATAILLLASLVLTAILTSINQRVTGWLPGTARLFEIGNIILSFLLTTTLFATIFKWLPNIDLNWSDVWLGAAITAVLMALGRYPIGLYLNRLSYYSAFGAAEALVVFLIWIYYSSWLFLFGAEWTFLYATRCRNCAKTAVESPPGIHQPAPA